MQRFGECRSRQLRNDIPNCCAGLFQPSGFNTLNRFDGHFDEGHRAISDLAFRTLYGFNACFVLELTATPLDVQPRSGKNPRDARYANVLVEITGRDLDREGMIKMPLNLDPRQGADWKATAECRQ